MASAKLLLYSAYGIFLYCLSDHIVLVKALFRCSTAVTLSTPAQYIADGQSPNLARLAAIPASVDNREGLLLLLSFSCQSTAHGKPTLARAAKMWACMLIDMCNSTAVACGEHAKSIDGCIGCNS